MNFHTLSLQLKGFRFKVLTSEQNHKYVSMFIMCFHFQIILTSFSGILSRERA